MPPSFGIQTRHSLPVGFAKIYEVVIVTLNPKPLGLGLLDTEIQAPMYIFFLPTGTGRVVRPTIQSA